MSIPSQQQSTSAPSSPKLLDRVRETLRRKHYSYRTEQAYLQWIKRFILFHHMRTTMIYTHVLNRGGLTVRSPLDESPEFNQ